MDSLDFLKDAQWPSSRDDLVILAEAEGAEDETLDLLESLPDVDFESADEVQEALKSRSSIKEEGQQTSRDIIRETNLGQEGKPRSQNQERPQPEQIGQRRSRRREIEERKKRLKEETGKLTEPGKTVTGDYDHRLKEHETDAIRAARNMEHGYDGRGRITNPEFDARLAENRGGSEEPKRQTWKELQKSK